MFATIQTESSTSKLAATRKRLTSERNRIGGEIDNRTHVAPSQSITVAEAADRWLADAKAGIDRNRPVEASTLDGYRAHADLHIKPVIGSMLLADLTPATVKYLGKKLHELGRSPTLIAKIRASLCGIPTGAVTDGLVARNVVREQRRGGGGLGARPRHRSNLRKFFVTLLAGAMAVGCSWTPRTSTPVVTQVNKGLQETSNCILTGLKNIEGPTITNSVNIVESGKVEEIVGTSGAYELYVVRLTAESDDTKVAVFHVLDWSDFKSHKLENALSSCALNVSLRLRGKNTGGRSGSFTGESFSIKN